METYRRKPDDKKYRLVSLDSAELRTPQEFIEDNQELNLPRDNEVLEIIHHDGSTEIIATVKPKTIHYQIIGNEIVLLNDCPRGRLWIRKRKDPGMIYKCPVDWKRKNNVNWFCYVGDAADVELIGDKYLNQIFSFSCG